MRNRLLIVGGIATVLLTVSVVGYSTEMLKPVGLTHLGQFADSFVVLEDFTPTSGGISFRQMRPKEELDAFSPPEGTFLVVTDIDWTGRSNLPGDALFFELSVRESSSTSQTVHRSTAVAGAFVSGFGLAGASVAMTTGFIIAPGETLDGGLGGAGSPILTTAHIRGYLVRDK